MTAQLGDIWCAVQSTFTGMKNKLHSSASDALAEEWDYLAGSVVYDRMDGRAALRSFFIYKALQAVLSCLPNYQSHSCCSGPGTVSACACAEADFYRSEGHLENEKSFESTALL